jgi:hypothetical protein
MENPDGEPYGLPSGQPQIENPVPNLVPNLVSTLVPVSCAPARSGNKTVEAFHEKQN